MQSPTRLHMASNAKIDTTVREDIKTGSANLGSLSLYALHVDCTFGFDVIQHTRPHSHNADGWRGREVPLANPECLPGA